MFFEYELWNPMTLSSSILFMMVPPSLLARAAVFTVKSLVWGGCLY